MYTLKINVIEDDGAISQKVYDLIVESRVQLPNLVIEVLDRHNVLCGSYVITDESGKTIANLEVD